MPCRPPCVRRVGHRQAPDDPAVVGRVIGPQVVQEPGHGILATEEKHLVRVRIVGHTVAPPTCGTIGGGEVRPRVGRQVVGPGVPGCGVAALVLATEEQHFVGLSVVSHRVAHACGRYLARRLWVIPGAAAWIVDPGVVQNLAVEATEHHYPVGGRVEGHRVKHTCRRRVILRHCLAPRVPGRVIEPRVCVGRIMIPAPKQDDVIHSRVIGHSVPCPRGWNMGPRVRLGPDTADSGIARVS